MKILRKFGRTSSHRKSLMRTQTTQVIKHRRIKTTLGRAKELRRHVDHVVNLSKNGSLHARRQCSSILTEYDVVQKLFEESERYNTRTCGFTRIVRAGRRRGDNAEMAYLELVD
eukprot:TRINITY_DN2251_c0_g1_i1.p1 TRINITY_DN2251_c0_g1~~TRINITY_DN2251_c0_g1_i1.p1  ORF type:complete len:114 (-),score=26.78 TRINITY_DN2251_c0_g1_i1:25-366(-)